MRFNVGGQCLNDAGNSSANGTRINIQPRHGSADWISSCHGQANQT
jgi:hypothetical protein